MSDFFPQDAIDALMGRVRKAAEDARGGRADGLMQAGRVVLNTSNVHVPHEDGDTERSGTVTVDALAGVAAISYKDQEYRGQAARLHEDMTLNHDEGRNAKFLENALRSEAETVTKILGDNVKRRMGT